MAAEDFLTEIYDKIWTLLEAHVPFTVLVKTGNRIKLEKAQPQRTNRQDADLIEAVLWPAELDDSMFTATTNFSYKTTFDPTFQPWRERFLAAYRLDLITPNLKITKTHQVILEALTALRKGGPRLGIDYVKSWGPVTMGERPEGFEQNVSGTQRVVSSLRIPVEMDFDGSRLVT